ncbi:MAG: hypothetical protein NHG07_01065 [Candidatus Shikimatogenerans bostrichidophilus]|nr:MAG: hypothetical protein NHG07_01065 [Candidatus Shikimatogenerans bostrichidophilus]
MKKKKNIYNNYEYNIIMKFLFSWIKEFIKFDKKISINKFSKILNIIGIEVLYIKKIYIINLKNFNKNIIKCKILFIKKKKKNFLFLIKIKNKNFFFIKSKKYKLKYSLILIENINNNYKIVCYDNDYDYVIKTFISYNISYLSYYYNLSKVIHNYLKYKNIKTKLINNKKNYIYKKKKIINNKSSDIIYYNSFILNKININYSNFIIQKKLILSSIKPINNITDIIIILIKELGISIELINYDKIKNDKLIIKNNNKNFFLKKKKIYIYKKIKILYYIIIIIQYIYQILFLMMNI